MNRKVCCLLWHWISQLGKIQLIIQLWNICLFLSWGATSTFAWKIVYYIRECVFSSSLTYIRRCAHFELFTLAGNINNNHVSKASFATYQTKKRRWLCTPDFHFYVLPMTFRLTNILFCWICSILIKIMKAVVKRYQ